MIQKLLAPRALFFLVFLCSAGLMAYAFYAQYVLKFEPCMLCMVQRVFMVALGVTAGIAALHNPKARGWLVYGLICAFWATLGAYIAGRHVYLQGLPLDQLEGLDGEVPGALVDDLEPALGGESPIAQRQWVGHQIA